MRIEVEEWSQGGEGSVDVRIEKENNYRAFKRGCGGRAIGQGRPSSKGTWTPFGQI